MGMSHSYKTVGARLLLLICVKQSYRILQLNWPVIGHCSECSEFQ